MLWLALAVPTGGASAERPAAGCPSGAVTASVAGKHVCLKAGQKCRQALDRTYHRYRFHCHKGRLTAFPAAPPPAPPAPKPQVPPSVPDPPPMTGSLVDVGGYRLMLECVGSGSPTVVMESGGSGTRFGLRQVQYAFASVARVCSYDRPGADGSQSDMRPTNAPPTAATVALELHDVLANGGEHGPYVLLGGSFGGILIADFTLHYPELVAGLVFVDSGTPKSAATNGAQAWQWDGRADFDALAAMTIGARPVVALEAFYAREAADFHRIAPNLIVAEATQYSHLLQEEAPGLVLESVRLVVNAVRTGIPLPTCAASSIAPYVSRCA